MSQDELFQPSIAQRFEAWKATRGGAFCLCKLHAITAGYYARWRRTGVKPCTALVWNQVRYNLDEVRAKLAAKGQRLRRERGFWLNDNFSSRAVRLMIEHRPEWAILFELRAIDKVRSKRKVVVITERLAA